MPSDAYEHSHLEERHRANQVSVETNATCSSASNGGFKQRQIGVSTLKVQYYLLGAFISPIYILFLELYPQALPHFTKSFSDFKRLKCNLCNTPLQPNTYVPHSSLLTLCWDCTLVQY